MDKPSFLFLLLLSAVALVFAYQTGFAPASPYPAIEALGLSAFLLICASLLIGPIAVLLPKYGLPLIGPRRAVGLAAFVFALMHGLLALALALGWNLSYIFASSSLLTASAAMLILLAIALTSNDLAEHKLGAGLWKNIQRFNYLVFVLVLAHFILQSRGLPYLSSAQSGLNLAELALLLLGILTVLLQVAGFITMRRRRARSEEEKSAAGGASGA
ncbi:MAG: hypothetical protein M1530_03260 [Candidatus Marsarchaeota archaeon]|nr:hypothetical protein [Candidatus Marsarchaeota archaeon]